MNKQDNQVNDDDAGVAFGILLALILFVLFGAWVAGARGAGGGGLDPDALSLLSESRLAGLVPGRDREELLPFVYVTLALKADSVCRHLPDPTRGRLLINQSNVGRYLRGRLVLTARTWLAIEAATDRVARADLRGCDGRTRLLIENGLDVSERMAKGLAPVN
jgi:hypothetical protein